MKKIIAVLLIALAFASCKNDKNSQETEMDNSKMSDSLMNVDESTDKMAEAKARKVYPQALQNIFTAHGGLDRWKQMNNICFHMKGGDGEEVHTISLKNRRDKIEHKNWTIGNDGKGVWLLKNKVGYEGSPMFYNNLMFYFYAMPFVLADEGTVYKELPQTELDGKMYNAYQVTFDDGVGMSSKDEYRLYFNTQTNKMEWLAYTVTFGKTDKNEDFHFVKYDNWEEINGLLLPEKLTWWKVVDGKPKSERNDMHFKDVTITETVLDDSVFAKPSEASYVTQ